MRKMPSLIAMLRTLGCAVCAAAALSFSAMTVRAEEFAPFTGEVTGASVRLRGGPSTQYTILKVLKEHEKLEVVDKKDGWLKVRLPADAPCWVATDLIKDLGGGMGHIAGSNVNLRPNTAGTGYPVGQVSDKNVQFVVDAAGKPVSENGFTRIVPPDEATGWVSAEFIGKATAQAKAATAGVGASAASGGSDNPPNAAPSPAAEEAAAFRELDKTFLEELAKPTSERDLGKMAVLYRQYADCAQDPAIRARATERIDLIKRTDAKIKAMLDKAQSEADASLAAAREAEQKREAQAKAAIEASKPDAVPVTYIARGFVADHGRNAITPASHALVDGDGNVVYYLRWDGGDLDQLWQKHVAVAGEIKNYEGWEKPVIIVTRCVEEASAGAK